MSNSNEYAPAPIRWGAGLGNRGAEYARTRHNIGFMVVDLLVHESGAAWEKSSKWDAATTRFRDVTLVKPASYMNRGRQSLFADCPFLKVSPPEIFGVVEEFSLPLGRLRIRQG